METASGHAHVAAEGRQGEAAVFGHEQIEHLPRFHFQRPVAQKIAQRIRRGERRQAKHALIHRKKKRLARMRSVKRYGNAFSRLHRR